jgi:hypothetical protein
MQPLQIRFLGGMWRVCQGDCVLAFARSYRFACIRATELEALHNNLVRAA